MFPATICNLFFIWVCFLDNVRQRQQAESVVVHGSVADCVANHRPAGGYAVANTASGSHLFVFVPSGGGMSMLVSRQYPLLVLRLSLPLSSVVARVYLQ